MRNQCQILSWKIPSSKKLDNKLHSLCSYMAMFPPGLPRHFIEKYSKEGDKVLDPFSGRATTILESCLLGREGIGNDKNPLAHLLTKSKSNLPSKKRLISKLNDLEREYYGSDKINIKGEEKNIRMLFHDYTLRQLIFLKNKLDWKKRNVDAFIASMIVGIIHGNSEGYLSISMPNTFSMSSNYIKNYIKEFNLQKPRRDVFNILRKRLEKYSLDEISLEKGKAYNLDARNIYPLKNNSIDLIITSPPYTKVIRYGQFNWIRLWFLDKFAKDVDGDLFFTQSIDKYCYFMSEVLKELKRVLKSGKKLVLVIGDIKEKELANIVWERCAKPLGFKLIKNIKDEINDDRKVSKIWGKKRGNVTKIDRILVLEKN